jgi:hypothetical protein
MGKKGEKFNVILSSNRATIGSATPANCQYNMGTVYNNAPALQKYEQADSCFVKVANFSIKYSASTAEVDDTSNILIKISSSLLNTLDNLNSTQPNLENSRIIGSIPTGASSYTYSNVDYDNDYVKVSNIFKGLLSIELTDQAGADLTDALSSSNPYTLELSVMYEDNEDNNNINY